MTKYRHPYNRAKQPDRFTRPPIPEWLVIPENRAFLPTKTRMQRHSVDYWLGMYWATPPWLSDGQVGEMKSFFEALNPATHHGDHIVPLHHPLVCGLNVPWNLQALPWRENLRKSNHHWPDCPDHLCPIKNGTIDMFEPLQRELVI